MATIKSYTDLNQSRKLAEILPLESADMWYQYTGISIKDGSKKPIYFPMVIRDCESDEDIPCWSLAALLNYLREIDFFPNIEADEHSITMNINYYDEEEARMLAPVHDIIVEADTFVDACYDMIIRLRGQNIW